MGEYWKPVNVTRKEWIHPHDMNDGLRWGEWSNPESKTVKLMREAWAVSDLIYAVSDYDGLYRVNMHTIQNKDHDWRTIGYKQASRIEEAQDVPTYEDLGEGWGKRITTATIEPSAFSESVKELQASEAWCAALDAIEQHGADIEQAISDATTRAELLQSLKHAQRSAEAVATKLGQLWHHARATLR